MEKISIIVGKQCMEVPGVILFLQSKYNLLTTDLAADDIHYADFTSIQVITLNADEILQFASFFQVNKSLQKIGFTESSLLFLAKSRGIKVVAIDKITQSICEELGIETVNIHNQITETSIKFKLNKVSCASRFNILKITACL